MKNWFESQGTVLLLVGGIFLFLSMAFLIVKTGLNRSLMSFELLFFLPFLVYLILLLYLNTFRINSIRYYRGVVISFTVLIQLLILTTEISLSDDIYRFLLEGKMILNGFNPYITSIDEVPNDLLPNFLPLVNNSHITSPYPPLALFFFAVLVWIREDPLIFRITFSASFILSIILLDKLLTDINRWKSIIFAWNPLFHLEIANGSHYEPLIIFFIVIFLLALKEENRVVASIALLVTILLKYYTVFIIPIFWKHLGKDGKRMFGFGMLIYIVSVFLYPSQLSGVFVYADEWYFNASIMWILFKTTSSFLLSKIISALIFLSFLLVISYGANKSENIPYYSVGLIIGLFLLFQPTFHPWYLFWLFPFIIMDTNRTPWSWIILSGLVIFSYNVFIQFDSSSIWFESGLIRLIQYIPFYVLFLFENRKNLTNMKKNIFSLK